MTSTSVLSNVYVKDIAPPYNLFMRSIGFENTWTLPGQTARQDQGTHTAQIEVRYLLQSISWAMFDHCKGCCLLSMEEE